MRRKLLLMNLALLVLGAAGVWRLRIEYRLAAERYRILNQPAPPAGHSAPGPPPPAMQGGVAAVQPAAYLDAAEKYLFSPDRNPNVVVEPPKIKPRPALPVLFGVMNLGDGPIAIMAAESNAAHKAIHIGDKVGEFKLLGATGDRITLEWEGQTIQAEVSDVLVRAAAAGGPAGAPNAPSAAGGPAAAPGSSAASVVNPNAASRPGEYVIGAPMPTATGTVYASPAGDSAPNGAVYEGKRKVVRQTPFGPQAWWEDVRQ